MVGSGAPAKRLRYSPESLYAPQSRIQLDATTVPFSIGTTPNKGTFSAAAVKSAADVQQSRMDRPHAASEHGHRLNASAIPWQPFSGFFGEQQSGISSGFGWQAGFDHAHADNEQLGSTPDKRAEEIVKHVFEDVAQQEQRPDLQSNSSIASHWPLQSGSAANVAASKSDLCRADSSISNVPPLPDSLLTPIKESAKTNGAAADAATADIENAPPHAAFSTIARSYGFTSCEQHSTGNSTNTPTSVFGRLRTRSPSVSSTVPTVNDLPPQPVHPIGMEGYENMPLPMPVMASSAQKRARPVQRGVHPAEINKRITNAQECWHILDIVNSFGAEFDAVNVATALHRIAKQRPDDAKKLIASNTFKQLVMMVDVQADQCKPQQIANIMWAFGTLSYKPQQRLVDLLAREALSKLSGFNPQNLANFIWAYARMDIQPGQDVLQAFFAECEAKLVHFAPQNISNMLWACATLTVSPGRKFLTTVTIVSLQQLRMFTPQAVKDTLWAMATMGFTPSKPFLQGAADICLYLIAQFNPQNIANAIWAFAKFSFNPGRELLSAMATQAMQRLPHFNSQNMSNTLWAFASLNHHPGSMLLKVLQRELVHKLPHFTAQGIENVLWAFANLGHHPGEETLHAAACHISNILSQFNQQNLALALWAFAKLGWRPDSALLADACEHALLCVETMNPQNLSNILWALASMGYVPTAALLEAAAAQALQTLPDFTPQATVNLVWAFAAVAHNPGSALLSGIADDVVNCINEYTTQQVTVALWAFGKLETVSRPVLMQAVAGHMSQRINQYSPENLSGVLWAYAIHEAYPGPIAMDAAVSFICKNLQSFDGPTLANCLWTFAQLRHHPGAALLESAALHIHNHYNSFDPQAISLALVAFAAFGHQDASLHHAVCTKALQMPGAFNAPAVANTLWSLALLDDLSPAVWNSLLGPLVPSPQLISSMYTPKHLCQIYQAWLVLQMTPALLVQYTQPVVLLQLCQQAFAKAVHASSNSKHQLEVAQVLTDLGVKHTTNYLTNDGLFCADIMVQDHHVIIQVDEVHHWTVNTGQPIGPTVCRDKLLMARGWTALVIPYSEWQQLQGVAADHEMYLRRLLLGYVDVGPCDKQHELKVVGRMIDCNNTSTDEDEASVIPYISLY